MAKPTWLSRVAWLWHPLTACVMFGAGLRIYLAIIRGTPWFDELFSIHFSSLTSWRDTFYYWILETNPPFYTFFLRFCFLWFSPEHVLWLRYLSIGFGLGSIVLVYVLAKRLTTERAAIIATFLSALSGELVVYSTEIRVYSLLVFLTLISAYCYYRLVFEKIHSRWLWFGLAIANLALLYSHLTAVVFLIVEGLILIIADTEDTVRRRWFKLHIALAVLWLPWLVPATISKLHPGVASAWYFDQAKYGNANLATLLIYGFINRYTDAISFTVLTILLFAGMIASYIRVQGAAMKQRTVYLFLLAAALVPPILSACVGVYIPKYVLPSFPLIFIWVGILLEPLLRRPRDLMAALAVITIMMGRSSLLSATTPLYSFQPIADELNAHERPDGIILASITDHLVLSYFYHGTMPVIPIYFEHDNQSDDERIVRHNWYSETTDEPNLRRWLCTQLQAHSTRQFFMVAGASYDRIRQNLEDAGWESQIVARSVGSHTSVLYDITWPENNPSTPTERLCE